MSVYPTANTAHNTTCYDSSSYKYGGHPLFPESPLEDANALYRGFRQSQRGSAWKEPVQRYEINFLSNISVQQREMVEGRHKRGPYTVFRINERGKTRVITGEDIRDRTLKHTLCDDILMPAVLPHLIHDNGASIKGKGIDFTRRRLVRHLTEFYRENGGNDGYILLMDFSKFYDNIRHKELKDILFRYTKDEKARYLVDCILHDERIDVSYMAPDEYAHCMDTVFNSIKYQEIPTHLKTGRLFMDKHLDIGDQLAQVAGIAYPMDLDNYVKIVRAVRFYARYMDDSYAIHRDKAYLQELQKDITRYAANLGIAVNQTKTQICKLSSQWRFLQIQYSLTETGRVVQKIHPKAIARHRRKAYKLSEILPPAEFHKWFMDCYGSMKKYMSKEQRENMLELLQVLEEKATCTK